jgi:hypothetical protein
MAFYSEKKPNLFKFSLNIFKTKSSDDDRVCMNSLFCGSCFLCIFWILASAFSSAVHVNSLDLVFEPAIAGGAFVLPNENEFWRLTPVLKDKTGTLVSVGTFRTLFDAQRGEFSRVIMLDVNAVVTAFNQVNIDMIRELKQTGLTSAEQRAFYIWMLRNRKNEDRAPPLTPEKLKAIGDEIPENLQKSFRDKIRHGWLTDQAGLFRAFLTQGTDQFQNSYWGSDEAWTKIQRLIVENRISVVNGDIGGEQTVASIARALDKIGQEVSVVDLSNVPDFILMEKRKGVSLTNLMISNLRRLPYSADAEITFTGRWKGSHWTYFSMAPRVFFRDSKKNRIGSKDYLKFIHKSIEEGSTDYFVSPLLDQSHAEE